MNVDKTTNTQIITTAYDITRNNSIVSSDNYNTSASSTISNNQNNQRQNNSSGSINYNITIKFRTYQSREYQNGTSVQKTSNNNLDSY